MIKVSYDMLMGNISLAIRRLRQNKELYESIRYVYGVPNGGLIPACIVASALNVPMLETHPSDEDCNEVLVVDDLIDSGLTRKGFGSFPFLSVLSKGLCECLEKTFHGDTFNDWIVFPWEVQEEGSPTTIEGNITRILQYIGEDVTREGLRETPKRVVKSYEELCSGYKMNPEDVFKTFDGESYSGIVLLKNIEFHSLCEHHLLPFTGKASIAYIPDGKVIGVSKLARLLDIYARRLQIQERIGEQVVRDLMTYLKPRGAACIIEAKHMCMTCRGVNKQNSEMVTSSIAGCFVNEAPRLELMALLK